MNAAIKTLNEVVRLIEAELNFATVCRDNAMGENDFHFWVGKISAYEKLISKLKD
jgi:hypothetical protein